MKVIIVDDDRVIRNELGKQLENKGVNVKIASDGVVALKMLHEDVYDALITDVHMPNMDGISLVKGAITQKVLPQKLIFMSGGTKNGFSAKASLLPLSMFSPTALLKKTDKLSKEILDALN